METIERAVEAHVRTHRDAWLRLTRKTRECEIMNLLMSLGIDSKFAETFLKGMAVPVAIPHASLPPSLPPSARPLCFTAPYDWRSR
jgi:hypothetical protein